jgi:hypothetical protein
MSLYLLISTSLSPKSLIKYIETGILLRDSLDISALLKIVLSKIVLEFSKIVKRKSK